MTKPIPDINLSLNDAGIVDGGAHAPGHPLEFPFGVPASAGKGQEGRSVLE
jgi:hypothetical protein